jgi:hypothetical protein
MDVRPGESIVVASIAPAGTYPPGSGAARAAPAPTMQALGSGPVAPPVAIAQPKASVIPPIPQLRPQVPQPVRTALAGPRIKTMEVPAFPPVTVYGDDTKAARVPPASIKPRRPEAESERAGPSDETDTAQSSPHAGPEGTGNQGQGGGDPTSTASNGGGSAGRGDIGDTIDGVVDAVKGVGGLLLGALPAQPAAPILVMPSDVPALHVIAQAAPPVPGGAVPVLPPVPPAIIAGAPAVAMHTGQLLFPLPESAVVPTTVIMMPGSDIRPPSPRLVKTSRPRLRDPIPFIAG